jgi:NAD(P)-dependent dehydrogenase (short-subunit alcohol dehydrogenase family)
MTIADRAVLVTGANRGIGQALVETSSSTTPAWRLTMTSAIVPHSNSTSPSTFSAHMA